MTSQSKIEQADELRRLGESARRTRDLAAAQKYYEKATALLRNSTNKMKFAHTVRHLGDVYVELQNWPSAEPCFVEALNIYRSQPSSHVLDFANAIRAYAVLKDKSGKPDESRKLWAEAGRMYRELGISAGVEECNLHAGPTNESSC
jgi:tetratricopeptide (TPR) repeat protein